MRSLPVLTLILALGGCRMGPPPPEVDSGGEVVVTETDSAGVALVTISGSVNELSEWSLSAQPALEVAGDAAPYIGQVGAVEFWGGERLLVEDRMASRLYAFGAADGQTRLVAGAGDGPGEVRGVAQLSVLPGDTVFVFDYGPYRISQFGPAGDFLNSFSVDPSVTGQGSTARDAWALGSDRFLLLGGNLGDWPPPAGQVHLVVPDGVVRIVSADGSPQVPPLWFPGDPYVVIDGPRTTLSPLWNRPFVAVNSGRILLGRGLDYELLLLDGDLQPIRVIRWLDWREPVPPSMLRELRDTVNASLAALVTRRPDVAEQRIEAIFHPETVPEVLPALHSALLDENGRMWVSRFKPFEDLMERGSGNNLIQWRQEDSWHVLDPDGRPIARLRLPPRTRLLAVRSDRVAVVTRDDLDMEHVRVFTIEGPRPDSR